jgi:hypothetical protein
VNYSYLRFTGCLRKERQSEINDASQQAKKQALSAVDLTDFAQLCLNKNQIKWKK